MDYEAFLFKIAIRLSVDLNAFYFHFIYELFRFAIKINLF
jgi:hypothetical protein